MNGTWIGDGHWAMLNLLISKFQWECSMAYFIHQSTFTGAVYIFPTFWKVALVLMHHNLLYWCHQSIGIYMSVPWGHMALPLNFYCLGYNLGEMPYLLLQRTYFSLLEIHTPNQNLCVESSKEWSQVSHWSIVPELTLQVQISVATELLPRERKKPPDRGLGDFMHSGKPLAKDQLQSLL